MELRTSAKLHAIADNDIQLHAFAYNCMQLPTKLHAVPCSRVELHTVTITYNYIQ